MGKPRVLGRVSATTSQRDDVIQRCTQRIGVLQPPIHQVAADAASPPVALEDAYVRERFDPSAADSGITAQPGSTSA
jgi:hypothetical protein